MLQHKYDQLVEKDRGLTNEDEKQREKIQLLRTSEHQMASKEVKMIEMGKKLYNIDFSDH